MTSERADYIDYAIDQDELLKQVEHLTRGLIVKPDREMLALASRVAHFEGWHYASVRWATSQIGTTEDEAFVTDREHWEQCGNFEAMLQTLQGGDGPGDPAIAQFLRDWFSEGWTTQYHQLWHALEKPKIIP
jgi:hypothetical protein